MLGIIDLWNLLGELEAFGFENNQVAKVLTEHGVTINTDSKSIEDFLFATSVEGFTQAIDEKVRLHFAVMTPKVRQASIFDKKEETVRAEAEAANQLQLLDLKPQDPQVLKLREFLFDMWRFNCCAAWLVIKELREAGVKIILADTIDYQLTRSGAKEITRSPEVQQSYPELTNIESCEGLTNERIEAVRQIMIKESEKEECSFFPPGLRSRDEKKDIDTIKNHQLFFRKQAEQMIERDKMTEAAPDIDPFEEWTKLNAFAKLEGLPEGYVQDLFERVCKQLEIVPPELTVHSVLALRSHMEKDFELKNKGRAADANITNVIVAEEIAKEVFGSETVKTPDPKPVLAAETATPESVTTSTIAAAEPSKPKRAKKGEEGAKETPTNPLENLYVTNFKTGEAITFNEATRRWFDLQIKKATIEIEMKMYTDQCKARLNEVIDAENGWLYCYQGAVSDVVREQFEKQKKVDPETKKVTYKPATVKTEYATFKRDPDDLVSVVDEGELAEWARTVPEAQRIFYGDIIKLEVKVDKKAAMQAVRNGDHEIPGVAKKEGAEDLVGTPKMTLSTPHNKKESEENSEGNLTLVDDSTQEAA